MTSFAGKKIIFGVCGGIAAFKAAGWVSSLRKEEALVTVVMTEAGTRFVAPLTFAALSGNQVYSSMFDPAQEENIPHISLARDADLIIVAPATAQTISKLAHGQASDLLSTVILATSAPVVLFPAMNSKMYNHAATQANMARLREFGYTVAAPASGLMACGEDGPGRLPEWEEARGLLRGVFSKADLSGEKIIITAGPTREPLDPVRYLSNPSTGKMGYALAQTAKHRGAEVLLISGPTTLSPPNGVDMIRVTTAAEMREAVFDNYEQAAIIVKSAAVVDFRPAKVADRKVKKEEAELTVTFLRNPDILKELGERKKPGEAPFLVGFAAESHEHLTEGERKLREKNLDLIVINDITGDDAGFAADTNRVTLLDHTGAKEELPLLSKEDVANHIWDTVIRLKNE